MQLLYYQYSWHFWCSELYIKGVGFTCCTWIHVSNILMWRDLIILTESQTPQGLGIIILEQKYMYMYSRAGHLHVYACTSTCKWCTTCSTKIIKVIVFTIQKIVKDTCTTIFNICTSSYSPHRECMKHRHIQCLIIFILISKQVQLSCVMYRLTVVCVFFFIMCLWCSINALQKIKLS